MHTRRHPQTAPKLTVGSPLLSPPQSFQARPPSLPTPTLAQADPQPRVSFPSQALAPCRLAWPPGGPVDSWSLFIPL